MDPILPDVGAIFKDVGKLFTFGVGDGGPLFISGEPRRNYHFSFFLTPALFTLNFTNLKNTALKKIPDWVGWLSSALMVSYVSGLVEKFTPPSDKIVVDTKKLAGVDFPYISGVTLPPLQVSFLEDEFEGIYCFHRYWSDRMVYRPWEALGFNPPQVSCMSGTYINWKGVPIAYAEGSDWSTSVPIPVTIDNWPAIFPSAITRTAGDKGGNELGKTDVTYTRVPSMILPTSSFSEEDGNILLTQELNESARSSSAALNAIKV